MKYELNDYHRNIPDEKLLEDVKKVANMLRKETITLSEYKELGKFSYNMIRRRFGSWIVVLKKCNLSPHC